MSRQKTLILFLVILLILVPLIFFTLTISNKNQDGNIIPTIPEITKPAISEIPTAEVVPDQLIVKFKTNFSPDDIKESLTKMGVISWKKVFDSNDSNLKLFYLLVFKSGTDLKKATNELKNLKEVDYVETNKVFRAF